MIDCLPPFPLPPPPPPPPLPAIPARPDNIAAILLAWVVIALSAGWIIYHNAVASARREKARGLATAHCRNSASSRPGRRHREQIPGRAWRRQRAHDRGQPCQSAFRNRQDAGRPAASLVVVLAEVKGKDEALRLPRSGDRGTRRRRCRSDADTLQTIYAEWPNAASVTNSGNPSCASRLLRRSRIDLGKPPPTPRESR